MPAVGSTRWPADPTRLRRLVLGAAVLSTLLKLVIASRTFGTNDVHYWADFAEGVDRFGPIGIYGQQYEAVYNHPPLVGWALAAANWLVSRGMDLTYLTRVPASVADVGTAVLLFELLRRRIPAHEAGAAAVLCRTLRRTVRRAGFDILEERSTGLPLRVVSESSDAKRKGAHALDELLVRLRPQLFAYQYVLRLTPHVESQLRVEVF